LRQWTAGKAGRKSSADRYAGADIEVARRFSNISWGVGTLLTVVLAVFFPPIEAFGAVGWLITLPGTLLAIVTVVFARRHRDIVSFDFLYYASWLGIAQLALLQWQAGGREAPYHELYLFQLIGIALLHPTRRFVIFAIAVGAAAAAPAFYAPADTQPGEIATEMALWIGLGVFLLLLMKQLRAQRTELKQAGADANQLARVDVLTGLGNRRAFDEALASELVRAAAAEGPVRLVVADINDFKSINDSDGHVAGDDCLRQVAEAIRVTVRESDSAYRWGGDEFAVLVGQDDATALAARIEGAVVDSCRGPDGRPLSVTCGHAEIEGGATPADVVAAADRMLMGLKRRGPEPTPPPITARA
jgi:diguanylate cyclase (GGDEF)-like protein